MKVFNLYNDELDNSNEREGWTFRAAKVGEHIGGELIWRRTVRGRTWQQGLALSRTSRQ